MASKAWIAGALLLAGCAATFEQPKTAHGKSHSVWTSHYLLGTVGQREVDVRQFCASGRVSEVETGANLGTLALSVLTIGIYTPRVVHVTCAPETQP